MTAVRKLRQDMPSPEALQRKASDPDSSIWVGASAGSGKTTVLVNRVLRLLLAGVKPQKILCLTFTRAAAAQMAIRISEALSHWATCSDDELRDALDKLQDHAPTSEQLITARRLFARMLSCPGGMRIRTIHAFAQEILRRFPIEAGLPPHFTVIEEIDARALQEDVQARVLGAAASAPESEMGRALHLLVRELGERGFQEAMCAVLNDRARIVNDKNLLKQTRALFNLAPGDTEKKFCREAIDDRVLPRADMLQVAKWLLEGGKTSAARGQKMLDWLALPVEERATEFESYCDCFFTDKGEPYKNYGDKKLLQQYPDLDLLMRHEATRLQLALERMETARMVAVTEAVLTLGAEFLSRFKAHKAREALLDYDDLILRSDELLGRSGVAPWVLYKLDGGLDHILVDEAQDTSRVQWNIVQALAEEFFAGSGSRSDVNRTLFVVGDEKQSIFSFQHADPEAFAGMREFFAERIRQAEKPFAEVPLHMSFRSAPAILRAVDAIFANENARAGVSKELVEHFPDPKKIRIGRVELWPLIPPPQKDQADSEWTLPLAYEKERDQQAELAGQIAARIRNWIKNKEKLPGYARPIEAGDIMILLRRRGRFADLMVRALKEADVPVTGVDRMKLISQLAVMDLLALMQFALLPEDDLNLATVLRGPLLGLSEEQLMELAIGREGSLWQSLKDKSAFVAAREYLEHWLNEADFATPFAMLAHMLNEPCPGSIISGRQALWARLGPDALDPIGELLNAAQEFGHRHVPSLQSFLHWLNATGAEIKRELDRSGRDQGGNEVRIMTVHAAKGLEAPIVFLPDTASMPRAREMPRLLWSAQGAPLYLNKKPRGGPAWHIWEAARQKQLEEYRRLFYVALTRAENRLYIGGWQPARSEGENANECWHALAQNGLAALHEPATLDEEKPLAEIAFADHGPATIEKSGAPRKPVVGKITLPAWARRAAPAETVAAKPLAPSQLAAESEPPAASPDQLYARGRIIHRLLESLPDVEDAKRDSIAARFLDNPQFRLPGKEQKEIAAEVLALLRHPDYAPLFGPGSRAEVALSGLYGKQQVAGQIDRLWVRDDEVLIVDYKSNRPPPVRVEDVSLAYRKQLAAYRAVLAAIYPGKTIRCFLLWTYKPLLMAIPDSLLRNA